MHTKKTALAFVQQATERLAKACVACTPTESTAHPAGSHTARHRAQLLGWKPPAAGAAS